VSLIGTLCPECYRKEIPPIRFKKHPSLILCSQCFATKSGTQWYYPSSDELTQFVNSCAIKIVEESLDLQESDELVTIDPKFLWDDSLKEIDISISLKRYGIASTSPTPPDPPIEHIQVALPLEYQLCPRCSRIARGSYEAILQIREAQGALSQKKRETILSLIEDMLQSQFKDHPQSIISKIIQKKQGMDLYFISSKCATAIAYSIRDSAAALIKITSKLVGLDKSTSKRKYRVNISVRLPPLRVGDFMILDSSVYEIQVIGGGKISLRDLKTGIHRTILVKTLWSQLSHRELTVLKREEYTHSYLVITETPDSLQIMNMKTYETYEVQKPIDKKFASGDVIQGCQLNEKVFLL
jgi:nonsense-mediated mRNA decay protein 3